MTTISGNSSAPGRRPYCGSVWIWTVAMRDEDSAAHGTAGVGSPEGREANVRAMAPGSAFARPDIEATARLIITRFRRTPAYTYPMRFALALGQRAAFHDVSMQPPSLDIGVNDGTTAAILHHGKPRITWGGDMPEESTYESAGLFVSPEFDVYDHLVGLDVSVSLPFADGAFNSVTSTEVFAYGIDRRQALAELARVLAPGGTLAFSESAEGILSYPALVEGLKQFVPTLDVLADPGTFYVETLTALGLTEIRTRRYLGGPL